VGGAKDGRIDHASFRVDLTHISTLFASISRLEWYSVAESCELNEQECIRSLITVHGVVANGNEVRLELLSVPPHRVKPGLHYRPDGMIYETQ
jgi:hypothetical protein